MINDLAQQIHANAKTKGFWHIPGDDLGLERWCISHQLQEKFLRLSTEIAELAELFRNGTQSQNCDKVPELTNEEEELADIYIRLLDLAAYRKVNLERAVQLKMQFNATRPYLHGKEF